MKKLTSLLLVVIALLMVPASPAVASTSQFAGVWINSDPNTSGITRIIISVAGDQVTVQAFGKCTPTDCDFGPSTAYAYANSVSANLATAAQAITAQFTLSFKVTTLTINLGRNNTLQVQSFDRFTDSSNRTAYTQSYTFVRGGQPGLPSKDCLAYKPGNLRIVQEPSDWLLTDGVSRMLIFASQNDAQNALKLAQQYDKHCFIGRNNTRPNRQDFIVEYWMGGRNAAPALSPEDCIAYNTANLRIVQEPNDWLLTDGASRMLILASQSDANDALQLAKAFKYQCFIGRDNNRPNRKDFIVQYWK